MQAKNKRKFITILLLVSMILCFCFTLININHNCTHDDNCPVCVILTKVKNDLSSFNPNHLKPVITIIFILSSVVFYLKLKLLNKYHKTPIDLKVRMNN